MQSWTEICLNLTDTLIKINNMRWPLNLHNERALKLWAERPKLALNPIAYSSIYIM